MEQLATNKSSPCSTSATALRLCLSIAIAGYASFFVLMASVSLYLHSHGSAGQLLNPAGVIGLLTATLQIATLAALLKRSRCVGILFLLAFPGACIAHGAYGLLNYADFTLITAIIGAMFLCAPGILFYGYQRVSANPTPAKQLATPEQPEKTPAARRRPRKVQFPTALDCAAGAPA